MIVAAQAPVEVAAQQGSRGQPGQATHFAAEVRLVGVPHVDREPRHAVDTPATGRPCTGLRESEEALEP